MKVQELSRDVRFEIFLEEKKMDYGQLQDILTWGVEHLDLVMDKNNIPKQIYHFNFKQRPDGSYMVY